MKIKIIDLLNKIANGEEVPEKIIFDGYIFEKDLETDYTCFVKSGELKYLLNEVFLSQLNDEVEIIEEPKKIEKIEIYEDEDGHYFFNNRCKKIYIRCDEIDFMVEKFNELIDEINNLKEK